MEIIVGGTPYHFSHRRRQNSYRCIAQAEYEYKHKQSANKQ